MSSAQAMSAMKTLPVLLLLLSSIQGTDSMSHGGSDHSHDDVRDLVNASNQLGQRVYDQISSNYDNLVVSPIILHLGLTMAFRGSRGSTFTDMKNVLGFGSMSVGDVDSAYHELISGTNFTNVRSISQVFVGPNVNVDKDYMDVLHSNYTNVIGVLDFNEPRGPEYVLNGRVATWTANTITDLVNNGTFSINTTEIVVPSALTFEGTWDTLFDSNSTTEANFHPSDAETISVHMMKTSGDFAMKNAHDYTSIKLPFAESSVALYIVVPRDTTVECMAVSDVEEYFNHLSPQAVTLYLPKFEIRFRSDMSGVLRTLGLRSAFTSDEFFSNVSLTFVPHGAAIKITEDGAVVSTQNDTTDTNTPYGAGNTNTNYSSINIGNISSTTTNSSTNGSEPDPEVRINKPFLFFLRDDTHGDILLRGKWTRPLSDPQAYVTELTRNVPSCNASTPSPNTTPNDGGDAAVSLSVSATGILACIIYSFFSFLRFFN